MKTPLSDAAIAKFPIFTEEIHSRLDGGRRTYGDSSFERPLITTIEEIKQELYDVAGWAFIMWSRLDDLERRILASPPDAALLPPAFSPG